MVIFPHCTTIYPINSTKDMETEVAGSFSGSKTKIAEGPRHEYNLSSTNGSEDIPTKIVMAGQQKAR